MITRVPAVLAVCICAIGCVTAYSTPRQPPPPARPPTAPAPPPPATPPAGGHASGQAHTNKPNDAREPRTKAKLEVEHLEVALEGKSKSHLVGNVKLTDVPGGVKVVVRVENIKPGAHAVHITEVADCSAADARSAGRHLNPDNNPHGLPSEDSRHLGDLGNIMVKDPERTGRLEIVVPRANLVAGAPRSLLNRALVVHADADDGKNKQEGNSGERIGCAELTITAGQQRPSGKVVLAR